VILPATGCAASYAIKAVSERLEILLNRRKVCDVGRVNKVDEERCGDA